MKRAILIVVAFGIALSGFEGAAELFVADGQEQGHDLHNPLHGDDHDDGEDVDHEDHFCHCGLHLVAMLTATDLVLGASSSVGISRYESEFAGMPYPPLLRPPIS
jgi:hypothetical protein